MKSETHNPKIMMDYIKHYSPKYLDQLTGMLADKQKFEFFAGIGMMATGTHQFKLKCANEMKGMACEVLERNFPPNKYGDEIRLRPRIVNGTLHQNDFDVTGTWGEAACILADLWVRYQGVCFVHASPPCQDYSTANAESCRTKKEQAKKGGGKQKQETEQKEHGSTWVANPEIAAAIERYVLAYQPTYFTVEQVPGFFVSDVGKHLYATLVNNGYNVQVVTMQAALHHDEDHLNNTLYGLSSRVRGILLASRADMATIQLENPSMKIPGRSHFAQFGSKDAQNFIKRTKLETSAQPPTLDLPDTMQDRFPRRAREAGLGPDPNLPEIGHVVHPTRWLKCYKDNSRSVQDINDCRISGCMSGAVMTTPTTAGRTPNEVMPTYNDQYRIITPAEAAVLMGITNLNQKDTMSKEPQFYIVPKSFDSKNREDWNQAFKGVGNGVPIGMARAIGKAVDRAVIDSKQRTTSESSKQSAMIKKRKKQAEDKQAEAKRRRK
jgi:site-specific DNA-cytosine methylase